MGAEGRLLGRWALPLALAAPAAAAALGGEAARALLRYQRDAVLAGEWWRLLTAHLAHLGPSHLLLNLAGLALVWLLVGGALGPAAWGAVLLLSALAVSGGLLLLDPGLAWYVGLSGVLHGLLAAGAAARLLRPGGPQGSSIQGGSRAEGALLLALLAAKLAWEQTFGPLPGSAEAAGGPVVVDAHLYGAIGGGAAGGLAVLAAALLLRRRAPYGAGARPPPPSPPASPRPGG